MAINCYSGLQGSGKSYEVVSNVIVSAIAKGRRVVTNIDGVNNDLIRAYVCEKQSIPLGELGHVVHVTNAQVQSPSFFPLPADYKPAPIVVNGKVLKRDANDSSGSSQVLPGDLVAIDEAYKFWGTNCKIYDEHMVFFREHRHFTHPETGVACDLVLMTQDIGDLHRLLKVVIELSFRTHKAKAMGLDNTYTVTMWEGVKQHQKNILNQWTSNYDPEIFPLYKSYAGEQQGKEVAADARQNIFTDKRLLFKIGFMVFGMCFAMWHIYHFFYDKIHPASPSGISTIADTAKPSATPKPVYSPDWRIAGTIVSDGVFRVVLVGSNTIRLEPASSFRGIGYALNGNIDGLPVTRFSGPTESFASKK